MTLSELFTYIVEGKKVKRITDDNSCFLHYSEGKFKNQNNEEVLLEQITPSEYEPAKERQFVYQWCFYNTESNDWVINPTLMTEEKAKDEFEKADILQDLYFKTGVKFNVFL
jgi:hypothetical protein